MLDILLIVADILLLFLYPMKRTVTIWKSSPIEPQGYKESVIYWMLYSTSQAGRWMFPVVGYTVARFIILFLVMFKLTPITNFLFRLNKSEKTKNS
jgi:hypothetical protein